MRDSSITDIVKLSYANWKMKLGLKYNISVRKLSVLFHSSRPATLTIRQHASSTPAASRLRLLLQLPCLSLRTFAGFEKSLFQSARIVLILRHHVRQQEGLLRRRGQRREARQDRHGGERDTSVGDLKNLDGELDKDNLFEIAY